MFFRWLKRLIVFAVAIIIVAVLYFFVPFKIDQAPNIKWGTTFTKEYAKYLGLDWKQTYLAILNDLEIDSVRIGINWNEIEINRGEFYFDDYDWMFDQAEIRNIKILPIIGFKLPRWPECRAPEWTEEWIPKEKSLFKRVDRDFEQAQLNMIKKVVEHFQYRESIEKWQVENEAFIGWFGDCPPIREGFIKEEVELVRALDSRPILMTESGELSIGFKSAFLADIIGSTLYREVWTPTFGMMGYPFPPSFYDRKAKILRPWASKFIIAELQLEVWAQNGILGMPPVNQVAQVTPEKIKEHIDYAKRTGADEIYTWGAEWWWWLKLQGYPQIWETVREEINK